MEFTFYKYHGTGNDFIVIDNRSFFFPKEDSELIKRMCDRHFGIGADGLILLEEGNDNLYMSYFNADGRIGSMCGNGGRCFVHFARYLGLTHDGLRFGAFDGKHEAKISNDSITLKMSDVSKVIEHSDHLYLDTGSPHHVQYVDDLKNFDVKSIGKEIRNRIYGEEGANVNFVEKIQDDIFYVRTYERGVEEETLSCGTGVTAVALASYESKRSGSNTIRLKTHGGELEVKFEKEENRYTNIQLTGPATMVYKGEWKI
jgi:diaminopimelate epimerase